MDHGHDIVKRRHVLIGRLDEAYSRDQLTLEDYERRVAAVEQANTIVDLEAVVEDSPDATSDLRWNAIDPAPRTDKRAPLHPAVWLVPTALLVIAPLSLPYGYYVLLRLVVCAAAALLTYDEYRARGRVSVWSVAMAGIMMLFNPIIPVGLPRSIWAPIDILTAFVIVFHFRRRRRQ